MENSITNNSQTYALNAYNISDKNLEAGSIVVKPPDKFYRYSIYDELNLERDIHSEFMQKLEPKAYKRKKNARRAKKAFSKILALGVAVSGAVMAFKHRAYIKNGAIKAFNAVKNFLKK